MRYVIIGNGTAACAAIATIRKCDREGKITVVSDERYTNYSRPLISYFLGKKVTLENLPFREKEFYKNNKVKLILDNQAQKLDIRKKFIILSNQRKIYFDKLLIATGGKPIAPEIKGKDTKGVFTFTRLCDAQEIEKYIKANKAKKALIIGGGLIGLKATEALVEVGIKVTIVELADRILSNTFDKKASTIIESALEKVGCKLITNNIVTELRSKDRRVKEVILRNKKKIPIDLVIVAIGVVPNIELVKNTPIKADKGILVDRFMQTSVKDIYAAGDCCEAVDLLSGQNRPLAIWPVAARQGKIAGYNMAGEKKEYEGNFVMNSIELCGIPTISVGQTNLSQKDLESLECFDSQKPIYKKVILKDKKIVGAIFLGKIDRAGIYTGLIKDRVDTTSFKKSLLKEDFGLINLPKKYRKHLVKEEAAII